MTSDPKKLDRSEKVSTSGFQKHIIWKNSKNIIFESILEKASKKYEIGPKLPKIVKNVNCGPQPILGWSKLSLDINKLLIDIGHTIEHIFKDPRIPVTQNMYFHTTHHNKNIGTF